MELDAAVRRALGSKEVRALKDYFLASAFSISDSDEIREWTLLFYNKKKKKTVDAYVTDMVAVGEEMPAQKEMAELRAEGLKIDASNAIEKARKNYMKKAINMLITLHTGEKTIWTITFISTDITATSYDIDAVTGEILREETTSLMRREK